MDLGIELEDSGIPGSGIFEALKRYSYLLFGLEEEDINLIAFAISTVTALIVTVYWVRQRRGARPRRSFHH